MAATDTALLSLNAGKISRLALARIDLAKLRIAAAKQPNLLPQVLGHGERPDRVAFYLRPDGLRVDGCSGGVLQRRRPKTVVDLSQNRCLRSRAWNAQLDPPFQRGVV